MSETPHVYAPGERIIAIHSGRCGTVALVSGAGPWVKFDGDESDTLCDGLEMRPLTPFETCDFYDARECETLTCESAEEALEEYVDGMLTLGCDTARIILEHGSFEIRGFRRGVISDSTVQAFANSTLDQLDEYLGEDYGDPDGGTMFSKAASAECIEELKVVIRKVCDRATVWACERIATQTYEPEEVLALMKKKCPSWFEPEGEEKPDAPE